MAGCGRGFLPWVPARAGSTARSERTDRPCSHRLRRRGSIRDAGGAAPRERRKREPSRGAWRTPRRRPVLRGPRSVVVGRTPCRTRSGREPCAGAASSARSPARSPSCFSSSARCGRPRREAHHRFSGCGCSTAPRIPGWSSTCPPRSTTTCSRSAGRTGWCWTSRAWRSRRRSRTDSAATAVSPAFARRSATTIATGWSSTWCGRSGQRAFSSHRTAGAAIGWSWTSGVRSRPGRRPGARRRLPGASKPAPTGRLRDVVVAIDAGHGGKDPGAIGRRKKTREKHVTLAIARKLAAELRRRPGIRPVLVRDGDYFIPLRRRTAIARKAGADLFVSIHADAFKNRRCAVRPPTCSPGAGRAARRRGGSRRERMRRTGQGGSTSGDTSRWSARRWWTCPARVRTG